MITPLLEQMIWQGKAFSRSWCTGGAGVARIPVKKNSFIVITGITYHPFTDAARPQLYSDFILDSRQQNTFGLYLYTTKNSYYNAFRSWTTAYQDATGGDVTWVVLPGQPLFKPCYIVFDENVRINVNHINNTPESWANADYRTMPDDSDELERSQSYQTTSGAAPQNTLRSWNFPAGGDAAIYPNADQVPLQAVNAADATYEFQQKNNGALNNPNAFAAGQQNGMNYPLINFDYVEVFDVLPQEMRKG